MNQKIPNGVGFQDGQQSGYRTTAPMKRTRHLKNKLSSKSSTMKKSKNDPEATIQKLVEHIATMKLFHKNFVKFKGTHIPLQYKQQYDFSQRWEQINKIKHEGNSNLLLLANKFWLMVSFIILIQKIVMIWYVSVYRLYGIQNNDIFFVGLGFCLMDIVLKMFLLKLEFSTRTENITNWKKEIFNKEILAEFIGDLVCITYYIIQLSSFPNVSSNSYRFIIDIIVLTFLCGRFSQIYDCLVIVVMSYKYNNYVNLFGFITKIFITLHIFALLVYSLVLINPEVNWLSAIGKEGSDWITLYIYSMYFTAATIFTVGYGDIIPKNNLQINVIVFIQIVGMVLMGYIVSEIGHTLSLMRQNRQAFEHDLRNSDKLSHYYQLNTDLKRRVRNYIISNQIANEQLNIEEENNFLMKLNQELRNQVKHENQLKIIKTSLYFICNWSKKTQTELSKKLVKSIFAPNERLQGKDRLYILTKGKIDVFTQKRSGNKIYCKKLLKSIEKSPTDEVHKNVYGYSNFFSKNLSKLIAVAKDFTICYMLQFADMYDIIKDDEKDYEYYHQIKAKMELEKFPEQLQCQNLVNNRENYRPVIDYVLKKHRREGLNDKKNQRIFKKRKTLSKKFFLNKEKPQNIVCEQSESDKNQTDKEDNYFSKNSNSKPKKDKKQKNSFNFSTNNDENSRMTDFSNQSKGNYITHRKYERKYAHRSLLNEKFRQDQTQKLTQGSNIVSSSLFQTGKDYTKYFKKSNPSEVIKKMNKDAIKSGQTQGINTKMQSFNFFDIEICTKLYNNIFTSKF